MPKQLIRYMKSIKDLKEAKEFLELYGSSQNQTIRNSAEMAFIVSYTKPFSGNKESIDGVPNGLTGKFFKKLTKSQKEIHETFLKRFRNKMVAHSELSFLDPKIEITENGTSIKVTHRRTNKLLDDMNLSEIKELVCQLITGAELLAKDATKRVGDGVYSLQ